MSVFKLFSIWVEIYVKKMEAAQLQNYSKAATLREKEKEILKSAINGGFMNNSQWVEYVKSIDTQNESVTWEQLYNFLREFGEKEIGIEFNYKKSNSKHAIGFGSKKHDSVKAILAKLRDYKIGKLIE